MVSYTAKARRGAFIGFGVGVALALLLLALGEFSTGEPMEGVMMMAVPLSMPVGLLASVVGLGEFASTWVELVSIAIPLNASFWGAVIAVFRAAQVNRPPRPAA